MESYLEASMPCMPMRIFCVYYELLQANGSLSQIHVAIIRNSTSLLLDKHSSLVRKAQNSKALATENMARMANISENQKQKQGQSTISFFCMCVCVCVCKQVLNEHAFN